MKRWKRTVINGYDLRLFHFKGGTPDTVRPAPTPAPSPAAKETSQDVQNAKEDEKQRKATQQGYDSTVLTGGAGLSTPASTGKKTLLGG